MNFLPLGQLKKIWNITLIFKTFSRKILYFISTKTISYWMWKISLQKENYFNSCDKWYNISKLKLHLIKFLVPPPIKLNPKYSIFQTSTPLKVLTAQTLPRQHLKTNHSKILKNISSIVHPIPNIAETSIYCVRGHKLIATMSDISIGS